jgi:predicted DNA-binding transcriptional regulator AlpA
MTHQGELAPHSYDRLSPSPPPSRPRMVDIVLQPRPTYSYPVTAIQRCGRRTVVTPGASGTEIPRWMLPADRQHATATPSTATATERNQPMATDTRQLLTVIQAVEHRCLSRSKVYELLADATLPSVRTGVMRRSTSTLRATDDRCMREPSET